jgi:hypothetical protein
MKGAYRNTFSVVSYDRTEYCNVVIDMIMNFKVQRPSSEVSSRSTSREMLFLVWNPQAHYMFTRTRYFIISEPDESSQQTKIVSIRSILPCIS